MTAPTSETARTYVSRRIFLFLVVDGQSLLFLLSEDVRVKIKRRPEAVNISNMAALVDAEGKPHFKYIIEGANLFLTQQARLHLEKRKVILFKDSSTNKGLFCARFAL